MLGSRRGETGKQGITEGEARLRKGLRRVKELCVTVESMHTTVCLHVV